MTAENKSNELKLSRFYEAPVKTVWEAWTDPKKAEKWWGPRGFTLTTHSKDFRPGGVWHYTMHGPDGTDYPNKTFYLEIDKYSRMVYDHGGYDDRPPLFRVTVVFREVKGGTQMDMTMALATPEAAEEIRKFIKKAGGEATWDRLGEYLAKETAAKDQFVINRSFDVPVSVMYDMWTKPEHLSKWLPPTGMEMEFIKADIRPGGSSFYSMTATQGEMKLFGKASYLEFKKPVSITYTQEFCDEKGNTSRHPLAPVWPKTMITKVLFTEEGPSKTRVTVTWEAYGETTAEELEFFLKSRGGMTQGWTGSFDKLEAYLAENKF